MSLGQTLRAAREAKGLTPSQLAQQTHILVQIIEGLENENFSRIPAPIYGRGFVKTYAEAVGLDPLPLQQEFTLLYKGEKPTRMATPLPTARPPLAPPPVAPPQPPPAPTVTPPPLAPRPPEMQATPPPVAPPQPPPELPLQSEPPVKPPPEQPLAPATPPPVAPQQPPPATSPAPTNFNDIPPSVRDLELFNPNARQQPPLAPYESPFASSYNDETAKESGPSAAERFRAGLSSVSHGVLDNAKKIPRSVWRISFLGVVTIILLILAAWGCILLYKATTPVPVDQTEDEIAEIEKPAEAPKTKPTEAPKAKPAEAPKAKPAETPKAKPAETPKAKPAETPKAKPAETPKAKPTPSAPAAGKKTPPKNTPPPKSGKTKPTRLRSTGQKIPPLYVD